MKIIVLLLMLLVPSLSFVQASSPQAVSPQLATQQVTSPQIEKLNNLDNDISELYNESKNMTGTARDVVRLQLLNKNDALREMIQDLIDERTDETHGILLKQVNQQVEFIADASKYLLNKIAMTEKVLEQETNEGKLSAQKSLDESRRFSTRLLADQWTNYQWLKLLDQSAPAKEKALIGDIERRLGFMSASLTFDNQQEALLSKQLKSATEGEKTAIQLEHIIAQRKVNNDITTLQFLVTLADKMSLDTTQYKQQLFEATGTLTDELLNVDLILSIVSTWGEGAGEWLANNAPELLFKLLIFVAIILAFRWLKKLTRKMVKRAVSSPNLQLSRLIQDFFTSMSGNVVFAVGLLIALSQVGVDLTPILTGFGVAGLVIGFALQDTLSNFASGMMLLIYRPFDEGDFVEAGGVSGKVAHMSLVNTTIKTFDNQVIIVPNSKIWGDIIKNITHERVRRVDMVFGIGYSDDIALAETVLADIVLSHALVLKNPETMIKLHTLNTSSVDFIVRPWVKTEDYWDVYWDITREVKIRFDKEGLSIPFPQQDVHLHMVDKAAE
ncbi:mechanosensitive ion channel family protein [Moritella sp. Urea-trap-13]|uniref:mechanosensitive ion channel family protein n=1 Tax=Moritella sp. Urea-trap-13 TaxID=2058327 RepID=UPI000C34F2DC|nr:mechanosensitive ion channel family protein [Moritella sp. Urea-trap-13]PKH09691.1 mechanosensitive ion channel protein MscS [Moritella sp. Urea-trap-13]